MVFVQKTWKDRVAEYINRRILTKEDGTTELVTVERSEGTISQEGDAFNAANMNDLEQRIADEFSELNGNLIASDNTPFRFGVNENGEYGYIVTDSEGADTLIPFRLKSPDNYIYNKGDLCVDISGGWGCLDSQTNFTNNAISTVYRKVGNSNSIAVTVGKVPSSRYNKIILKGQFMQHGSYGGFSFGLTSAARGGQANAVKEIRAYRFPTTTGKFEELDLELDISDVTQDYWFFVRPYYGPADVYEIYFE